MTLPHGSLETITENTWHLVGRLPHGHLPRRMVVHRLASGGLWIHSAIALDDEGTAALEALGRPEVLVVPNGLHRLDAPAYKRRYPDLKVFAPANSLARAAAVVSVDGSVEEAMTAYGIEAIAPPGTKSVECAYFLPSNGGRVLVVADLFFNLPRLPGIDGWLFGVIGSTGFFGVTRLGRLSFVTDRMRFATWIDEVANNSLRAIAVAHGDLVTTQCGDRLREAAQRLRR